VTVPRRNLQVQKPARFLDKSVVEAIVSGHHGDPYGVLGVHADGGGFVARCFIPGASSAEAFTLAGKATGTLSRTHDAGFFEGRLHVRKRQPVKYRARGGGGEWWASDPYSFGPVLGPMDDYYIREGSHLRLFDKMGAHVIEHEGAAGVHFAVWAPNARRVSVVGDFNAWDGRRNVMRLRRDTGIWETFIPGIGAGRASKYEIASAIRPPIDGVMRHTANSGGTPTPAASRYRSMKCMPAPGKKPKAADFCPGTNWATG
jgi:1,4-alpha-glucan branching enzyme